MPDRAGPPPVAQRPDQSRAVAVIETKYATVVDSLRSNNGADAKAIKAMLGGDKGLMDRFLAVTFSALAKNPDILLNCTAISIVQSVKDAASLGLDPTGLTGEGAIIRYGDTAQFQPMWRGYVKRIRNSGKVVDVDCQIVFINDTFRLTLGTNPGVIHEPILVGEKDEEGQPTAERGDYRGCYAWALMPSGKYIIEYMTVTDINAVRDRYSKAKGADSPWSSAWTEMARKTVIKRLAKRLPGEAVDQLIRVEAINDQAAEALTTAAASVNDSLADVRRLALQAASGEAAQPTAAAPSEAPGTSEPVVKVATMCGARSPYGDGQVCDLDIGHRGNHRGADKSTWT